MSDQSLLFLRYGVFAVFAGLMLAAAIWDIRKFIIPNWLNAAILMLFPVAALLLPDPVPWLSHFGAAVAGFLLMAPLFFLGWLGAGDVKMFGAVAAWTGFGQFPALLAYVVLAGGLLGLVLLILRHLAPRVLRPAVGPEAPDLPKALCHGGPLPYGVAIAVGGFLVAFRLPYLPF